jgi:hypothetical protein
VPDTNSIGFLTAYDTQPEIRNDVSNIAINWYVNRTPLITRLARRPVGSIDYTIVTRKFRPRTYTLAAALAGTGTTATLTLNDTSPLMIGDVLEIPNTAGSAYERVEVTADPVGGSTNTVAVKRAVDGTSDVANDFVTGTFLTVRLIGNSRTGAEINQSATNYLPTAIHQYNQTFQHPVQVGGSLQSSTSFVPASDANSPFDQAKMEALQNLMDDMEVTSYYGGGESPASGSSRPKQKGVRTQIASNNTTAPTNAGAYKPSDLIRDTIAKCFAAGGQPDTLLLSPDFQSGLSTWGMPAVRIPAGETMLGVRFDTFEVPFLSGLTLIYGTLLRTGTAVCFNSNEVMWRNKRNEYWNPRGIRGDAVEGDFMAEGSIQVDNEYHHAWVEGITAFSAT